MTDRPAGAGYSDEQLAIQRVMREFARKEVAPGADTLSFCLALQELSRVDIALDVELGRLLGDQAYCLHDMGQRYA